jgi:hypothetical protein
MRQACNCLFNCLREILLPNGFGVHKYLKKKGDGALGNQEPLGKSSLQIGIVVQCPWLSDESD